MSEAFFRFQQFVVHHERCAMKVGTDGVLLGAWARGGRTVLDIGTGTGLIALMMAQRYEHAMIDAVEIDSDACQQARENVSASPFSQRIHVINDSVQHFVADQNPGMAYDAIVCNPPFFENALKNPDRSRTVARHSDTLPFSVLFRLVSGLLKEEGEFSAIIPFEYKVRFEEEALHQGLSVSRVCAIHTTPRKPVRRYLLAFRRRTAQAVEMEEVVLEMQPNVRSDWYDRMTKDFYIKR